MSEKGLTKAEWDKFSKGQTYKDAALIKALVALEKADKAPPEDQLKALDELVKQADTLIKAHKGDKGLAAYLTVVDKSVDKCRQEAQKALKAAAATKGKEPDKAAEEDDEPASVLLDPKRLLAQLTLCKRDPERTVQFGFVDAKDKQDAVLAMSPKMSGRKLFSKLQAELGVKTGAYGTAWVDGTQLMLQLDKPLGGLVKKVRAPVKACGFRVTKVVLWNEDGTVFEQDEDAEGATEPAAEPTAPNAAALDAQRIEYLRRKKEMYPGLSTAVRNNVPAKDEIVTLMGLAMKAETALDWAQGLAIYDKLQELLKPSPTPQEAKAQFDARLTKLAPRIADALKAQHPEASKIRAVEAFAREKAASGNLKAALAALDSMDKLLGVESVELPDAALWARYLPEVQERFKTLSAINPKYAARLQPQVDQAIALAKAGHYTQALAHLEKQEGLMIAAQDWDAKLKSVIPLIKEAVDSKRPGIDAERLRVTKARGLADKDLFEQAYALLDEVEASLSSGEADSDTATASAPRSFVDLQKNRLAWDGLRKNVQAQLQSLEQALLAAVKAHNADESAEDEVDEAQAATQVRTIYTLLERLDERLIDKLDEALNAGPGERERLNAEAADIVKDYQTYVDTDPLIASIDDNGFIDSTILSEVQRTLTQLASQL